MKDNKITVVFSKKDADMFNKISKKSQWTDKFIVSVALRHYYEEFNKDWEKAVIKALKREEK